MKTTFSSIFANVDKGFELLEAAMGLWPSMQKDPLAKNITQDLRLNASGNPFCALLISRIPVFLPLVERVHLSLPI